MQYQYDPAGNTTVITSGSTTGGAVQPVQVETRGYNTHNRMVTDTVTDPTGATTPITTITNYDRDGHVYQQVSPNGDSTVNIKVARWPVRVCACTPAHGREPPTVASCTSNT